MSGAPAVGVFGKLPARGDFVDRSLPGTFTDTWHRWIVRGLGSARARLGAGFTEAYLSAPVWRFILSRAVASPAGAVGIFLPSVDSAGRCFPLALVCCPPLRCDPCTVLGGADWFARLEALGRCGLAPELELAGWLAEVDALEPPTVPMADGTDRHLIRVDCALEEVRWHALQALARRAAGSWCLFWSAGSPFVQAGLRLADGLPEGDAFTALLSDEAEGPPH